MAADGPVWVEPRGSIGAMLREGWGGRPVRVEQAQGILVAALGMLAGHYGYNRSKVAAS